MRYRSEIDGLRAIAVIPVIFFHAGFSIFSGGFVGVDIFFVISGYLITGIILSELESGTFSIVNFYERRARRILPALFLVLIICLPSAWLWLLPHDMMGFLKSLIAVSLYSSNILFWKTSSYFETATELKPLLHTWSLAVEEQYYLFFPAFIMLTWRLGKRYMLTILVVVAGISLATAQWGSVANPDAAFYLLPTRGWELLIGSFVAFYFSNNRPPYANWVNEAGSAIGFLLIIYSVFVFDKHTPFPSLYTLAPTIGTALVIMCSTQRTTVGKLLSNKVLVTIGLISYSAYLWHQPLLAFAKHRSFEEPSQTLIGALAFASLILAYFTWKYVEIPFRNRERITRKKIVIYSVSGTAVFLLFGIVGNYDRGFQSRFSSERQDFMSYFDNSRDWQYFNRIKWLEKFRIECDFFNIPSDWSGNTTTLRKNISPSCYTRDKTKEHSVFIWGDSHAQQFYYGLKQTLPNSWQILQVASSGCKASLHFDKSSKNYCQYSNYFAHQTIADTKPEVVIIGQETGHSVSAMNEIADNLYSIGVRTVIFAGPSPHWLKGGLPSVVAYRLFEDTPRYSFVGLDFNVKNDDAILKTNFRKTSYSRYVSLFDYFCAEDGCLVYFGDDIRSGISTYDYGHLAPISSYGFSKNVLANEVLSSIK